jgi:anaerobic selenocysteine-containing dehydrogenase
MNASHAQTISSHHQAHQVLGACPHDCPDTCALVSTVINNQVTAVHGNPDHPSTDGVLCTKVARYHERMNHPDRLLYPMKRVGRKGEGLFERISWEEALSTMATRLQAIAARDPQAILPYSYAGTMGQVQGDGMAARFFHRLGASLLDRTICASAGAKGLLYSMGASVGMHTQDFAHSKLIVIWGSNPITSNLHFWRIAMQAKRDGAKLICIDPRRTETAEKCDEHLAIRPATDAALALAIMRECVVHGWVDENYLQEHTLGWPAMRERAMEWTCERAAEVCGLAPKQIADLARAWGTTTGAAIRMNYGIQRVKGGGNAVRAVACLPAVTGAWKHRGGGFLLSSSGYFQKQSAQLQRPDLLHISLHNRTPRTINMSTIGHDLLRPSSPEFGPAIEALVVYNSNPVAVAPQSGDVVRGFAREDLFTVVLEHFQTDTADYADLLLPATMQLEHWDIHTSYGHTDVLLNRPAVTPPGEALSNAEIFRRLASCMGYTEACFADTDLDMCRQAFDPALIDFERLLERGWAPMPVPDQPFAQGGFRTPSGRFEFWSQRLADAGLDPLPNHIEPYEAQGSAKYPLAMISPPARNFLNSTFVNVDSLQRMEHEPLAEIHPDDAKLRGIVDGMTIEVFNERGVYVCKARVNSRARPGVVNCLGIWWRKLGLNGTNVNELTHQRLTDLGQAPSFYDCAVDVRPA